MFKPSYDYNFDIVPSTSKDSYIAKVPSKVTQAFSQIGSRFQVLGENQQVTNNLYNNTFSE